MLPYHPLISGLLSKVGSANSQQLQALNFPKGHLQRQKCVSHLGLVCGLSMYLASAVLKGKLADGSVFFFRTQVKRKPNVKLPVSAPSDIPVSFPSFQADYFTEVVTGR